MVPDDGQAIERVRGWLLPIVDAVTAQWHQLPRSPVDRPTVRTMVVHEVHRRLVDVAARRHQPGDAEQALMLTFAMLGARHLIELLIPDDAERRGSE